MYFHSLQSGGPANRKLKPEKPWYRKLGDGLIYGSRLLNAGRNIYKFMRHPMHWLQYGNDYLEPRPIYHPNAEDAPEIVRWDGFGRWMPNNWYYQKPNDLYRPRYFEEGINIENVYKDPHSAFSRTKTDIIRDAPGGGVYYETGEWGPWTPYRSFEDLQDFRVC